MSPSNACIVAEGVVTWRVGEDSDAVEEESVDFDILPGTPGGFSTAGWL